MIPSIEPHPDAPVGSVTTRASYTAADFTPDSVVLCRNTASLVAFAFALLRRSVHCNILGRDIGAGLTALVRKLAPADGSTFQQLRDALSRHLATESERLLRKGKRASAQNLEERVACVRLFCSNATTVKDILTKIDPLFESAPTDRLTLSTIHKAKGLEWPTVFLLDRHLIPSKWCEAPWELVQERNLMYVAVTRAKLDLVYIRSDAWAR